MAQSNYLDKDTTAGGSSTTTAKYYNKDSIAVPAQWISRTYWKGNSGDKIEDLFTPCVFNNFLDSDGNPIKGYLPPEEDSWMASEIEGDFFDGTKKFKGCIKRGRMPVFSSEGYSTSSLDHFAKSSNDSSTGPCFKPFFSVSQGESFLIYPKDDCLEFTVAGNPPVKYTYYPSDFRDGVLPEVLYIVIQGAGGGGGGTTKSSNGGGGGAGGILGALVNLKLAHNGQIQVSTGAGGLGGYKNETDSDVAGKGSEGDSSYICYYCNSSNFPIDSPYYETNMWYYGMAWAHGGGAGGDAGVSGVIDSSGSGGDTELYYPWQSGGVTSEEVMPDSSFLAVQSSTGGWGGVGGSGSDDGGEGQGAPSVIFSTTKTRNTESFKKSATYHTLIAPAGYIGGEAGDDRSGGGAGSHFGFGGDGGIGGVGTSQEENNGRFGGLGAGGGGARYYFGRYNRGGDGGGGVALVFY